MEGISRFSNGMEGTISIVCEADVPEARNPQHWETRPQTEIGPQARQRIYNHPLGYSHTTHEPR